MSEATSIDDVLTEGATEPSAGVPTSAAAATTDETANVTAMPDYPGKADDTTDGEVTDTHPEVMDTLPSIKRTSDEPELKVDDNFNFNYVLKNGKTLKTSVVKPDLGISTKLSDTTLRFNESKTGQRYMMVNNVEVYQMIMKELIRVILVDGAPLHTVTFESLSKIGMTKSELDDFMGIITTFYLSE